MDLQTNYSTIAPQKVSNDAHLRRVAQEFEATFLAEMLKSAGFGQPLSEFGGGVGEDQFASLLVEHQAKKMVEAGGLGLAETIYQALKEQQNEQ